MGGVCLHSLRWLIFVYQDAPILEFPIDFVEKLTVATQGMKVLVVEDNEVNLLLMQSILKLNGCNTLSAMTSSEGIDCARRESPDLIFLDIQLPDGDGLDAAVEMRKFLGANVPIAVLTAHAFQDYRIRAGKASCQYFITKPLSVATIESVLREVASAKDRP